MKAAILFGLMALTTKYPADDYRFERKEFEHTTPTIRFVIHKNAKDLIAAAPPETVREVKAYGGTLQAWSALTGPDLSICTVHIIDPSVSYQPEWIGHEIAHCIYGRWHR